MTYWRKKDEDRLGDSIDSQSQRPVYSQFTQSQFYVKQERSSDVMKSNRPSNSPFKGTSQRIGGGQNSGTPQSPSYTSSAAGTYGAPDHVVYNQSHNLINLAEAINEANAETFIPVSSQNKEAKIKS